MSRVSGAFTLGSVGSSVPITGFGINPTRLTFRASGRNNLSSNTQIYLGSVDDTGYQGCDSVFDDGTHRESRSLPANTRCIMIREYVSGAWVTRVEAAFVSYITDGFELNVVQADSAFDIWVDAED